MNKIIAEDINEIISANVPWQNFSGKTVLISGAAGFLPSYLVHTLLQLNESGKLEKPAKVIAVVRNKEKAEARFADYLRRQDFKLILSDITQSLEAITERIDFIIHAASQASPKFYGTDPVGTLSANVLGTYSLLELAQRNAVECFLYFSSSEVYGQLPLGTEKASEVTYGYVDPMAVRACYAESKRMGENICVSWFHQFKVPIKVVRPFHTYGPGMQLDDGRVFADFVADIVNNRHITMKSDGSAIRAFCYLVDATIGFFTVLLKGEVANAYNVGNDEAAVSIAELAYLLTTIFPEKKLQVIQQENNISKNYLQSVVSMSVPETAKLRALGWAPHYDIYHGFRKTLLSFL